MSNCRGRFNRFAVILQTISSLQDLGDQDLCSYNLYISTNPAHLSSKVQFFTACAQHTLHPDNQALIRLRR